MFCQSRHRIPIFVKMTVVLLAVLLALGVSLSACNGKIAGAVTCRQALEDGIYDTQMRVYGTVSQLGNLGMSAFLLSSDGRELTVFYDDMMEDNGDSLPAVNVADIKNGDRVVVTGELMSAGKYRTQNSFWSSKIEKY